MHQINNGSITKDHVSNRKRWQCDRLYRKCGKGTASKSTVAEWNIEQRQFTIVLQITTRKLDGGGGVFKVYTLKRQNFLRFEVSLLIKYLRLNAMPFFGVWDHILTILAMRRQRRDMTSTVSYPECLFLRLWRISLTSDRNMHHCAKSRHIGPWMSNPYVVGTLLPTTVLPL